MATPFLAEQGLGEVLVHINGLAAVEARRAFPPGWAAHGRGLHLVRKPLSAFRTSASMVPAWQG